MAKMNPEPQPKHVGIITKLGDIFFALNREQYQFELNRYKNDAHSMSNTFPVMSNIILGIISSIEGDIISMRKYHQNAITLSNADHYSLSQYAISLSNTGHNEEAYKYFLKAYKAKEDDPVLIERMVYICYYLGKDSESEKFKNILKKMNYAFQDPDSFIEDNDKTLMRMISDVNQIFKENPDSIVKPDSELITEIDELIAGVDIS